MSFLKKLGHFIDGTEPGLDEKYPVSKKLLYVRGNGAGKFIRDSIIFRYNNVDLHAFEDAGTFSQYIVNTKLCEYDKQIKELEWERDESGADVRNIVIVKLREVHILRFLMSLKAQGNWSMNDFELRSLLRKNVREKYSDYYLDDRLPDFGSYDHTRSNYLNNIFYNYASTEERFDEFCKEITSEKLYKINKEISDTISTARMIAPNESIYLSFKDVSGTNNIGDARKIYNDMANLRDFIEVRKMQHLHKARATVRISNPLYGGSCTEVCQNGESAYNFARGRVGAMGSATCTVKDILGQEVEIFSFSRDMSEDLSESSYGAGWRPKSEIERTSWYTRMMKGF